MKKTVQKRIMLITAALCMGFTGPAWASQGEGPASSGLYFGDGLRHLTEGDYGAAVEALFRAYGMAPSPQTLGLIIEAYDRMGHCDAVEDQLVFYRRFHGEAEEPGLNRCGESGVVEIDCGGLDREVFLDRHRRVECGAAVRVPAGKRLRVDVDSRRVLAGLEVESNGRVVLDLTREPEGLPMPRVPRLRGLSTSVDRLPGSDAGVAVRRLEEPTRGYRIYHSADGIYQVWVARETGGPHVEILCPEDAPSGQVEEGCELLREVLRRDHGAH